MKGIFRYLVFATFIALGVRYLGMETFRIASDSMAPSLLAGDWVMISKLDYSLRLPFAAYEIIKFRRPTRSQLVAFNLPDRGLATFIKRVVAISGDTVEIKKGILSVNGSASRYEKENNDFILWEIGPDGSRYRIDRTREPADDYGPVDVPQGHFFVLSDQRKEMSDSRVWGPIPFSCLKGRVRLVLLSLSRQGDLRSGRTFSSPG